MQANRTRVRLGEFVLAGSLAIALLVTSAAPAAAAHQFSDVPEDHPFHDDIAWMASNGIADGYPDGTYRPGAAVTRQSMAAFLHRLWRDVIGREDPVLEPITFSDVPADHPFHDDIAWLATLDIADGYPDGTYRPGAAVTRQSMAAFLHRFAVATGVTDPPLDPVTFTDVPEDHPFHDDIAWMATLDIADGYPDGTYRPGAAVTRQSMAAFLHRLFDSLADDFDFLVDSPADVLDAAPGDGSCDIDAPPRETGDCTLRAAIGEANALTGRQEVFIYNGIDPTLTLGGATDDANAGGDLDITDEVSIFSTTVATIDANGLDRVLDIHGVRVALGRLTMTGGESTEGSGIRVVDGDLSLVQSHVADNHASTRGGGLLVNGGEAHLSTTDITDNSSASTGGGIAVADATLSVNESSIGGNTAPRGGGLHLKGGDATVFKSEFVDNTGVLLPGGGIRGGGIYAEAGELHVDSSTLSGNVTEEDGAGGALYVNETASATIEFSTLSGNHAADVGGAILNLGALDLTAVTIADNTAEDDPASIWGFEFTVKGSVLTGADRVCNSRAVSGGYNVDADDSCGLDHPTDRTAINSLLSPLADHGGPTRTHASAAGSALIDAIPIGTPDLCMGRPDQRRLPRPVGPACDIGSVEGSGPVIAEHTFVVDSAADGADATPGNGTCATGAGACTLRAAITEANVQPGDDTITITPGIDPTLSITGADEDANATGDLDITNYLTIDGNGATIDADGIDRVLDVHSVSLDLREVTLTGGYVSSQGGGGIRQVYGRLGLTDATVSHNTTDTQYWSAGGGIKVEGGSAQISSVTVADNVAEGDGGGLFIEAELMLTDSTITGNQVHPVYNASGGGLSIAGPKATIDDVVITDNVVVENSSGGGGIAIRADEATISDTVIAGNDSEGSAGGILMGSGNVVLTRSIVSDNRALGHSDRGGGIRQGNGGTLLVDNSTISGNTAATGTEIASAGIITVNASTIFGNDAFGPSALWQLNQTFTLRGSVLNGGYPVCEGVFVSAGYNLATDASCQLDEPTDRTETNPLLSTLGDHGGPTDTFVPAANSPLVDAIPAGTADLCEPAGTDQRGTTRPVGAGCDIGSVEGTVPAMAPLALVVTNPADAADLVPGDGLCTTASSACTLRAAIDEANARPTADAITIHSGVDPVLAIAGAGEDGNATGDLDVTGDVVIHGGGATIDADGIDRILHVRAGLFFDPTLTIENVTLTGGQADEGGALLVSPQANAIISGSSLHANSASMWGGAVSMHSAGTLDVTDTTFTENQATTWGGALHVRYDGVVTITGSSMLANTGGYGGAIQIWHGSVTFADGTLSGNSISASNGHGGAVSVLEGVLALTDSDVSDNHATDMKDDGNGGGVYLYAGEVSVTRTTMAGNTTAGAGGAIYQHGGVLEIVDSALLDNVSASGGAVFQLAMEGTLLLRNSTIAGNTADHGGGLVLRAIASVEASTIAGNTGDYAIGVGFSGAVSMQGTIVQMSGVPACSAKLLSGGHNLVSDTSCFTSQPSDQVNADALLGPGVDNGGPTKTMLPAAGSPALDAIASGTANLCTAGLTDQRGVTRPQGTGCDVGAVERSVP